MTLPPREKFSLLGSLSGGSNTPHGPGWRVGASGLRGLDDGLVSGVLAASGEVVRCPGCGGVLTGSGPDMGRRGVWFLRQGAGWHAQAERYLLVQGRPDAGRLRGPWGGAAPVFPHR